MWYGFATSSSSERGLRHVFQRGTMHPFPVAASQASMMHLLCFSSSRMYCGHQTKVTNKKKFLVLTSLRVSSFLKGSLALNVNWWKKVHSAVYWFMSKSDRGVNWPDAIISLSSSKSLQEREKLPVRSLQQQTVWNNIHCFKSWMYNETYVSIFIIS